MSINLQVGLAGGRAWKTPVRGSSSRRYVSVAVIDYNAPLGRVSEFGEGQQQ